MSINHHSLPLAQDKLPLTIARAQGTGAAVVIIPSAFGVASDLQTQMEELAQHASLVVAFDPFFRGDAGVVPYDDMKRVMTRLQALDRQRVYVDLRAAIAWVRTEVPGKSVLALGICFGGPFTLLAAADGAVDGIATWHGTRMENYLERAGEIRCPLRLHFGDADPLVPISAVEKVRLAFADHADVRIAVHAGAQHGFSHRAGPAYDARAEQEAIASLCKLATDL